MNIDAKVPRGIAMVKRGACFAEFREGRPVMRRGRLTGRHLQDLVIYDVVLSGAARVRSAPLAVRGACGMVSGHAAEWDARCAVMV